MGCIAVEQEKASRLPTNTDIRLLWSKCLKIPSIKMQHNIKFYHSSFPQIAKDVDRTFPQHPLFEKPETKKSFENILRAFALQFPKVGYTQGLNFVVGFLLIAGLNEQSALKAMIGLCSNSDLMLLGLYQDNFPLCRLYCSLFWQVAFTVSPKTSKLIKKSGLIDELWLFQWFITIFIYSLPLSYIQDIFNFVIMKRYFALIRIAVAILQCLEKYLEKTSSLSQQKLIECFQLMKSEQFCQKHLPISAVIKSAQRIKKGMIMKCLSANQCKNWYRDYFLTPDPHREKKYAKFIDGLNEERLRFEKDNSSDKDRYSRENSSVQIMDVVQDNKYRKYSQILLRSNKSNATFFSLVEEKNYNSLAVTQPQDI